MYQRTRLDIHVIADCDGFRALFTKTGATASFVRCTFSGNTIFSDAWGAAVIEADSGEFG